MTKQAAAKEKGLSRAPMRAPLRQDIPTDRAVAYRRDGTPVWRHGAASEDRLHIDPSLIPEGWTWEWKRFTVYNAPDPAYQAALARDGWEPVLAENYPGVFMPVDYKGPVIVDGLMLMERPSVLTEEARAEEKRKADAAINGQLGITLPHGVPVGNIAEAPRQTYVRKHQEHNMPRPQLEIDD